MTKAGNKERNIHKPSSENLEEKAASEIYFCERVQKAVADLDERIQYIIDARFVKRMSYEEIAGNLHITPTEVEECEKRGLRALYGAPR